MPRRGGNLPIRDKIYMALKLHETLNLPIPDNFPKPRNQVKRLNSVSDTTFLSPQKSTRTPVGMYSELVSLLYSLRIRARNTGSGDLQPCPLTKIANATAGNRGLLGYNAGIR